MSKPCCICEGRETIESLEWLQYQAETGLAQPRPQPVCAAHFSKLEECHRDLMAVRTPPVVVSVSAVTAGGRQGQH